MRPQDRSWELAEWVAASANCDLFPPFSKGVVDCERWWLWLDWLCIYSTLVRLALSKKWWLLDTLLLWRPASGEKPRLAFADGDQKPTIKVSMFWGCQCDESQVKMDFQDLPGNKTCQTITCYCCSMLMARSWSVEFVPLGDAGDLPGGNHNSFPLCA